MRSALLAGDGMTVHVNGEAARFTHHLFRALECFEFRAALTDVTLLRFVRLDFIIFGIQTV